MIPAFLRPEPWPLALGPGETVLAEGRTSPRRCWRSIGLLVLVTLPAALAINLALSATVASLRPGPQSGGRWGTMLASMTGIVAVFYWRMRRTGGWVLTSQRIIRQGQGAISCGEIGQISLGRLGTGIVHRAGPDPLLTGPRFRLYHPYEPRAVRGALERLR